MAGSARWLVFAFFAAASFGCSTGSDSASADDTGNSAANDAFDGDATGSQDAGSGAADTGTDATSGSADTDVTDAVAVDEDASNVAPGKIPGDLQRRVRPARQSDHKCQVRRAHGRLPGTRVARDDQGWGARHGLERRNTELSCVRLLASRPLGSLPLPAHGRRFEQAATGKSVKYGLGFGISARRGRKYVGYGGSQQKAKTHLRLFVKDQLCLGLMCNSSWASTSKLIANLEDAFRAAMALDK